MLGRTRTALAALLAILSCIQFTLASPSPQATSTATQSGPDTKVPSNLTNYVTYTTAAGQTLYLPVDRRPALYTGNFGDCLGDSTINVTRFDAAYYSDNMTVVFHLSGDTAIVNTTIMMYIGVYAYGENRFDLIFDPCKANLPRYVAISRHPLTCSHTDLLIASAL